jgi:broad-specificity NMP kinase
MYRDQTPGATLSLCMLRADPSVIKERFLQRGWNPHPVDEAVREVAELEHTQFADLRVDTDDHSVKEVARMVGAQAENWPGLT